MKDLSLFILDLTENALAAHASEIEIRIQEDREDNRLCLQIRDNGRGMDENTRKKALDPFFTTKTSRKIGLGLPFIKMAAELAEGSFRLDSEPGKGTTVSVEFPLNHLNTPPLGDLPATVYALSSHQEMQKFHFFYGVGSDRFEYDLDQIKSILDGLPLTRGDVMNFITEYIREHIDHLRGGKL